MKIAFRVYSKKPLGLSARGVVGILQACYWSDLRTLRLLSRSDREDLSAEEVLASAERSASDRLELLSSHGSVKMSWLYGPRAHLFSQVLAGDLDVASEASRHLRELMAQLCETVDALYGACDLERIFLNDAEISASRGDPSRWLIRPYWFNYFGAEYSDQIPKGPLVEAGATVNEARGGATRLLLEEDPTAVKEEARQSIAKVWPVFLRYDDKARFHHAIEADLTAIRGMKPPASNEDTILDVVGDPRAFLSSVSTRRLEGARWVSERGRSVRHSREALQVARRFESELRDEPEKLLNVMAVYGELVREECHGSWTIGRLHYRGEPVLRYGTFGLRVRPVVREFFEAIS